MIAADTTNPPDFNPKGLPVLLVLLSLSLSVMKYPLEPDTALLDACYSFVSLLNIVPAIFRPNIQVLVMAGLSVGNRDPRKQIGYLPVTFSGFQ